MPSWPETVHTRLRELCSPGRLDELHTKIAPLLDPTAFGRGRAMFFGAAGGPAITFGTQLDMGTSVSIGASAELRPLLAAMDAGRPAGIVVATIDITRIIEVADGEVKELETTRHAPPGFVWSELKERNHAYQEDMRRIVRSVAESVERWVTARSWDRLVVAGNARLTRPVVQELAARADLTAIDARRDVAAEEHPAQIQQRFADELDRAAASRAAALVDRARVMGAGDVLAAASDGRAAWVALDSEGTLEIAEGEWRRSAAEAWRRRSTWLRSSSSGRSRRMPPSRCCPVLTTRSCARPEPSRCSGGDQLEQPADSEQGADADGSPGGDPRVAGRAVQRGDRRGVARAGDRCGPDPALGCCSPPTTSRPRTVTMLDTTLIRQRRPEQRGIRPLGSLPNLAALWRSRPACALARPRRAAV